MRTVLTTLLFAFLLVSTTAAQPGPPDHARPIEGVILVKFAPEALETPPQQLRPSELGLQGRQAARLRQLLNARRGSGQKLFRNFTPADTLGSHRQTGEQVRLEDVSRWYRFPVRDTTNVEALADRLQKLPVVLQATPDYEASPNEAPSESGAAPPRTEPDDPKFSQQWAYDDSDDHDVDAPEAWSLQTGRSDVTVAVVDGGVDLDHPDLDPGDRSRVIQGYDFGDDDNDPDDDRPSGNWIDHGTPVAGTIGARTDNSEGVAGLMWDLKIMPLKIIESDKTGNPPSSRVAEAFDYARSNGADVINFSGSSSSPNGPRSEAAYNAYASGLVVVTSAGNEGNSSINYPAALHTAIGVGATDSDDERCQEPSCRFDSNYGPRLDIVAPSEFETTSRGVEGLLYREFGGTSQSAPVVSGIAGLLFAESRDENHDLSNNDIVHLLERTAKDLGPSGRDNEYGHGRVNAYEALRRLNDPYGVRHGTDVTFTKIMEDKVEFRSSGRWPYATGQYSADIYEMSVSTDLYFEEKPWFWLPVTSKGISLANPNTGDPWMSKSVSKNSADVTTYFYYIESTVDGQKIGWYPFDPTAFKHGGKFRWTAIGKPAPIPVDVYISGPTYLDEREQGTWTANVDGGSGSLSYQWYQKYDVNTSFNKIYGATSASYSTALYGNVTFKVKVTADNSSDSSTYSVSVDCDRICIESFEERLSTTSGLSLQGEAASDRTVTLTWQTPSVEVRSSGAFAVQHRADSTGAWSQIGTVPVSDSLSADAPEAVAYRFETDELEIGAHQFRVGLPQDAGSGPRAVGSSGTEDTRRYTGPVTAQIAMEEAYRLSTYPNPASEQATVELAVKERQEVSVRLYDVLGRQVATLHNGPLPAQELRRLRLDVSSEGLTSGTYFLRATGEDIAATEQITVVR